MLLSMTGFGTAEGTIGDQHVSIEIRSVNNRYFKLQLRLPEGLSALEPQIEKLLRSRITRGSVSANVRIQPSAGLAASTIQFPVAEQYWRSLVELSYRLQVDPPTDISMLLDLPGVVDDSAADKLSAEEVWAGMHPLLSAAVDQLHAFREQEGSAMADDLRLQAAEIDNRLKQIAARAPGVVEDYRNRLVQRINDLLGSGEVPVTPSDLIREVSIFADRCDINEEITRLKAHLQQFDATIHDKSASQGRKLEFLVQEMFREVNTIGSKANDVEIAHHVVAAKTALERIREVTQNVE